MAGLAEAVQGVVGQPATVRIGTVDSIDPLVVSAQGAPFEDVGVLPGYQPVVGNTVVLLGQCSATGSDPASWLLLGSPQPQAAVSAVKDSGIESTLQSTTSTVYILGTVTVGLFFTAPPSGMVLAHWASSIDNNVAGNSGFLSAEIREGDAIGAGTQVIPASDQLATRNANTEFVKFGITRLFTGLIPGTVYNASLWHRSSNGANTAVFNDRNIIIQPV